MLQTSQTQEILATLRKLRKIHLADSPVKGISQREYYLLSQICKLNPNPDTERPGVKITELGAASGVSKPAVSQILNQLEDKGLVERISAKSDRRVVYVRLTQAGGIKRIEMMNAYTALLDRVITQLGNQDTNELLRLVNKLYDIVSGLNRKDADGSN